MRHLTWILLACIVFALGTAARSAWPSIIALALFAAYSARLFSHDFPLAVGLLPLTLWRWTIVGALVAAEYGAYMPEIGREGRYVNATSAFVLLILLMYAASAFAFRQGGLFLQRTLPAAPRGAPSLQLIYPVAMTAAGVATAYMLLKGVSEGFPLFTQTDRFAFRLQTDDYWFTWVLGNAIVFPALLGVCFAYGRSAHVRLSAAGLTLAFVGAMFLFGEKFFSILEVAGVFVMPMLLKRGKKGFSAATWAIAAGFACAAIAATWYIYSDYGRSLPGYTLERIMSRVSAQGELWFASWADAGVFRGDALQWRQMMETIWPLGNHQAAYEQGTGIFYLMQRYAPPELWHAVQASRGAVTYTAGTEAYLVLSLGIAGGGAICVLLGAYYGLVTSYLVFALSRAELVRIFLAAKLLAYTLDASHQASLWNIAGTRPFVMIVGIIAYEVAMGFFRGAPARPTPFAAAQARLAREEQNARY